MANALTRLLKERERRTLYRGKRAPTKSKGNGGNAAPASALRQLTLAIARNHWGGRHHYALAEIARYLNEPGLRAEVQTKRVREDDRALGRISDKLRKITEQRATKREYEAMWVDPYAYELEQKFSR